MKRFLLSLFCAIAATTGVFAQNCLPDTQYTAVGVYPLQDTMDIGITPNGLLSPLPCAVANCPYLATFTVVVPTTFMQSNGSTVNLCNMQVQSIGTTVGTTTGLPFPVGLSYATLPANGIFNSGTSGCIHISGSATTVAMNELEITTKMKINLGFGCGAGITQTQHFPSRAGEMLTRKGRYVLTVIPTENDPCPCLFMIPCEPTENINPNFHIDIAPNPTTGVTYLKVASLERKDAEFKVTDIYGQIIAIQKVVLIASDNNIIEFDGSKLPVGAYYFTIDNGKDKISDKIIVQH